jgi:hypothetical protein
MLILFRPTIKRCEMERFDTSSAFGWSPYTLAFTVLCYSMDILIAVLFIPKLKNPYAAWRGSHTYVQNALVGHFFEPNLPLKVL